MSFPYLYRDGHSEVLWEMVDSAWGCRLTNAFWEGRECMAGKKEVRRRTLEGMVEMGVRFAQKDSCILKK